MYWENCQKTILITQLKLTQLNSKQLELRLGTVSHLEPSPPHTKQHNAQKTFQTLKDIRKLNHRHLGKPLQEYHN